MLPDVPSSAASAPGPTRRAAKLGFAFAWLGFVVLMVASGVQGELSEGGGWLRPLVAEGSSMLMASALAVLQWRLSRRLDGLLAQPRRWFARVFVWLPLLAPAFVVSVYTLRHAVHALLGQTYRHPPWSEVLVYETMKFVLFYGLFTAVQFGLRSYLAWHAERLRAERLQALSSQAQLLQLTQQLQPHFLFNALNTVSSLIHSDPDLADALLVQLARLLRAASDVAHRPQQPLADELALLQAYAGIMGQRFPDRVSVRWQIDDAALACLVPTLGLQPLLENCFRHAVEPRRSATAIEVRARREGQGLTVEVRDDGGTLAQPVVFGVGLGNLQRRLAALHGERASLALRPADTGRGVTARVELPCAC
ncbi:histidine kinase [Aquabacterium sp. A7-Y]|uniref:sensor histidine kinase n=1 Tax=Aquabacterium sp. A7-Y TaxID=1349605 RepID=UPI00223DCF70|nr:histidine kinase [Aquabacterium sp. A7-Y]MCW7538637.1 histidine kinase [Aquabacterium sp. A7-Y]